MNTRPFEVHGADGKLIRGDRSEGVGRQVLFITGFLSTRWGNKSRALAQWCEERHWGFCCYDVRGYGQSEGRFGDHTLDNWLEDARSVVSMLPKIPKLTIVGNSLGSWIAWLIAQEFGTVERLILLAPAFNMMGVRARSIPESRRQQWRATGWMPWDDEPAHRDYPIAWKWVEESEALWKLSFDRLRHIKTTIVHGLEDAVILPAGSSHFVEEVLRREPSFPIEVHLVPGDHRLSGPEHLDRLRRFLIE